jgi:hypothetical protein
VLTATQLPLHSLNAGFVRKYTTPAEPAFPVKWPIPFAPGILFGRRYYARNLVSQTI